MPSGPDADTMVGEQKAKSQDGSDGRKTTSAEIRQRGMDRNNRPEAKALVNAFQIIYGPTRKKLDIPKEIIERNPVWGQIASSRS